MADETILAKAFALSPADRLELIAKLWDSLCAHPADVPLTDAQAAELDRRLEEHRRNPEEGKSWEEVKRELLRRGRCS